MARHRIYRDGKPTKFFWSDKDGNTPTHRTVFKETEDGIKRMTGVRYDAEQKKLLKG